MAEADDAVPPASNLEAAMPLVSSSAEDPPKPTCSWKCPLCCCGCTCCLFAVLLVVAYFVMMHILTEKGIASFVNVNDTKVQVFCQQGLTIDNLTFNNEWPGCGSEAPTQSCTLPCYNVSILDDMDAFNKNSNWSLVTYQSRPGTGYDGSPIDTVELRGWWLPAPGDSPESPAPRILLQHGFRANSNKALQQFAAYVLRSLGFSVLLPNFRDHCYSDNTTEHVYQWSNAYPNDLLGAWDYARVDPDGLLGGPRDAGQVGLMGFSKGAFVSGIALGLEGSVPAAWLDSGPWTPRAVFENGARAKLEEMGLGFASDILLGGVWDNVKEAALEKGVDLEWRLPEQALPEGPDTRRPVYILQNTEDETVPVSEHYPLRDMLANLPDKYTVVGDWVASGKCNGRAHVYEIFRSYAEYRDELCSFWATAFGLEMHYCKQYDAV